MFSRKWPRIKHGSGRQIKTKAKKESGKDAGTAAMSGGPQRIYACFFFAPLREIRTMAIPSTPAVAVNPLTKNPTAGYPRLSALSAVLLLVLVRAVLSTFERNPGV